MRKEEFCEILGEINDKHILDARETRQAKKSVRFQWGVMVACLCLLVVVISGIHTWIEQHNEGMQDTMPAPMGLCRVGNRIGYRIGEFLKSFYNIKKWKKNADII